jgi:hypothetical protein
MHHIGVDLHKTNLVACFLAADDTQSIETYPLTRDGLARGYIYFGLIQPDRCYLLITHPDLAKSY